MKLLLIADADSIWTYRTLKHVILPQGYEVVLFPIWGDQGRFADFYRENHVTIYRDEHVLPPVIGKLPRVRMWARIARNARSLMEYGPFDAVENGYLSQRDLALGWKIVRKYGAHWVCDFWGSDLLRAGRLSLLRMKPYLKRCHALRIHNGRCVNMVRSAFGKDVERKTHLLPWGQEGYRQIDEAKKKHGREGSRAHFGIGADRFVVCVGYNASSAQQQLEALRALAAMPQERLKRMTLVLPQTYCEDSPEYTAQTVALSSSLPCQTVVLRAFMNPDECAMLNLSTDVFIHAIKTDAFSASMQEFMYAQATVIQGSWLVYPQFDDLGVTPITFDRFEELPGMVERAMDGALKPLSNEECERFQKLYSWDALQENWLKTYR